MPQPVAPPPSNEAGAITNPRQLQRWLDCNPVPVLTRTKSYFELPIFSVDSSWKGYSEIVAVFNYTASNNFTLKAYTAPVSPNYIACIMWIDADYNVYRYRLWEDAGEMFFFSIPLYTNQKIGKNFRIEIWNCVPPSFTQFTLIGSEEPNVNTTYVSDGSGVWYGVNGLQNSTQFAGGWSVIYGLNAIRSPAATPLTPVGTWRLHAGTPTLPVCTIPTTSAQASLLTLYTSKLGNYDYRYANDYSLATTPSPVTDLSVALAANLPISWPANSYPTINS